MGHLHRLIVFDLDGTLIDSRRDLADAANALIVEGGGAPLAEQEIGRMVGEGARVLVERALTAAGLPVSSSEVARFLELYDDRLLNTTRLYPGVAEAVAALASDSTVAVLTNKPTAPSLRILEALGLTRHISVTIGGDTGFAKKPDPVSLRHLMTKAGVPADRTVMVGDSWIDHETARRAGTVVCLTRYGFGFESFPTERLRGDEGLIDDPRELVGAIAGVLTAQHRGA